jgi:NADPH-dependent 2,4-dienoyl-CoA reductase/sulfur reductase-like enzyme
MTQVVVVGAGPAGLACAIELRRRGVDEVIALDREASAGGIPRHSAHQGFGVRDLHRLMTGPQYARKYVEVARRAGAEVLSETMVTHCGADRAIEVTSPRGRDRLRPDALVLSTGCRERPRAARLVAGSRPEGVMTTGMLQQLVHLGGEPIVGRALVVGAEHVSFSAVETLARAGARVLALVTELPRHQSLEVFRIGVALRYRARVWTRTAVHAIHGRPRVEEVELTDLDKGTKRRVVCDLIVFTDDWIPDHELAVMAGIQLDRGTRGPWVDTGLRTARPGIVAAGNLLHGAEPADVAALSGRHAAASVVDWRNDGSWSGPAVPIVCERPLRWIAPNGLGPTFGPPPRGRFLLRVDEWLRAPTIEIRQDVQVLWRGRVRRLMPGRSASLPWEWIRSVDLGGGPVEISVSQR